MQVPLQITLRALEPSDAVSDRVREKAVHLEKFSAHITSCDVTVTGPSQHSHKGGVYAVRVELEVPGDKIVAGGERSRHHQHEDVYVAMRDAFAAASRASQ